MKLMIAAGALFALAPMAGWDIPLCGAAYANSCCKVCHKGKAIIYFANTPLDAIRIASTELLKCLPFPVPSSMVKRLPSAT